MSCNKCQNEELAILPEGTVEAYKELFVKLSAFFVSNTSIDWQVLREISISLDKKDYVKARQLLEKVSDQLKQQIASIIEVAPTIPTAIDKCLALPLPKNTIKFNNHVRRTYQQPTMCSCATCKYVVRADMVTVENDEEYVFTKFACNYENRLVEAKHSHKYTKEEIMDQLSVDEQGKCACYEFGDQTDYDDICNPAPEPGEADVIRANAVN